MQNHDYGIIRSELELFLPTVGKKILELRRSAEGDPSFAQLKANKTLITRADGLSEDLIREWITERFPDDAIRGEERDDKAGGSHMWIVDPIDGTYNFNHQGAKFSISVGLADNNVSRAGVLYFPSERVTISAAEGGGVWMDSKSLALMDGGEITLAKAWISSAAMQLHAEYFAQPKFSRALKQQSHVRMQEAGSNGTEWCFTYTFLQFLKTSTDAITHPGATPYDIGAICAIARELGMPVSDYDGNLVDFTKDTIPVVISKNPTLHKAIIKAMNSSP